MAVHSNIQLALLARLSAASLPVAWPNIEFTKPADGKCLEVTFLPNASRRLFLSNDDDEYNIGIMQVDVVYPFGIGAIYATDIAGDIATLFPSGYTMTSSGQQIVVQKRPDIAPPQKGESSWRLPVSIRYESFA